MNNGQNLFIYRPLSEESNDAVQKLQKKYSSFKSFQPAQNPHVTLLGRYVLPKTPTERLMPILENGPETSEKSYSLEISDTIFATRTRRIGRTAIQLLLTDNDEDTFAKEHAHFRKIAAKFGSEKAHLSQYPHVTLGYLESYLAFDSLLSVGADMKGLDVTLLPVQSELGPIKAKQSNTRRKWDQLSKEERLILYPYSTPTPKITVRKVGTEIPKGFLSSIRPKTVE
jgi:2'-5' RNA ligase